MYTKSGGSVILKVPINIVSIFFCAICRFDLEKQGSITYETFLDRIGASEFTPGDLLGTSSQIIDKSKQFLDDHNQQQIEKHERITHIQANRAGFMTVEEVEQALKYADRILCHF